MGARMLARVVMLLLLLPGEKVVVMEVNSFIHDQIKLFLDTQITNMCFTVIFRWWGRWRWRRW